MKTSDLDILATNLLRGMGKYINMYNGDPERFADCIDVLMDVTTTFFSGSVQPEGLPVLIGHYTEGLKTVALEVKEKSKDNKLN